MAMIHVNRAGTNLGIFAEEDVREGLRAGRFAGSDLAWREGMAQWQPLSQFSEFASEIPTGTSPPPVPSVATSTIAPSTLSPASRSGLPWDERHQRGLFSAFFETLMMVLTQPGAAFTAMKREGGFGEPLIYALIGGCAGGIVSFLFSLGLQSVGFFADRQNAFGVLAGMGIGSVVFIIILPVLIVIGLFIGALIVHLCLMIVGGANHTFETTFRVLAFTQGSTAPLEIVPVCGAFIALIWGLVTNCIGLARAHETETWRAVLAVFLPFIVCCGGGILLAVMFAVGAFGHHGNL